MNDLKLFNYQNHAIRVVKKDRQTWWVAKDVCEILGLSNVTEALRGLDDDLKKT